MTWQFPALEHYPVPSLSPECRLEVTYSVLCRGGEISGPQTEGPGLQAALGEDRVESHVFPPPERP